MDQLQARVDARPVHLICGPLADRVSIEEECQFAGAAQKSLVMRGQEGPGQGNRVRKPGLVQLHQIPGSLDEDQSPQEIILDPVPGVEDLPLRKSRR